MGRISGEEELLALRDVDGFGDPGDLGEAVQAYAPGEPPGVLVRIAAACAVACDPASLRGGPCFTFPERLGADFPSPLPLLLADAEGRSAARELARPDNWRPGAWAELISGAAGEWAMDVHDGSPVSICHTPAAGTRAAEVGIWTRAAEAGMDPRGFPGPRPRPGRGRRLVPPGAPRQ